MTPEFAKLFEVLGAMSVVAGAAAWFRQDTEAEDAMVAEAADVVLEAISDADQARTIECVTGRNYRQDLTVEEAMALHEERELRRMGARRN